MKREFIYLDIEDIKFGTHITNVIPKVISSGKKFFLFSGEIYLLTKNFGAERTGLTNEDIIS